MLCNECGKKPATVHITKVENGKKTDFHLCEQCALQKNVIGVNTNFTLNDLLTGILNSGNISPVKMEVIDDVKCSICGLTYNRFKETGRFGCSNCYKTFGDRLNPLFKRVHGNTNHTGKIPEKACGRIKNLRQIEKLKHELETAIRNEEYEKAATLRDQIREFNKRGMEVEQ